MDTIRATEIRAKCFEILNLISAHQIRNLAITRGGKRIAVLTAAESDEEAVRNLNGFMRGKPDWAISI